MKTNKKFKKYITDKFKSYQDAADFFGCAKASVYFWAQGKVMPRHTMVQEISKKTKGAVPPESWYV